MKQHYSIRNFTGLLFLVLILFAGCSQEEQVVDNTEKGVPMRFGTYTTRGQRLNTLPQDTLVGVYGFWQKTTKWASWRDRTANLMNNQKMVVGASGGLTYTPLRYWLEGDYYSFLAVYPYNATADIIAYQATGGGRLYIKTNTKAEHQRDVMVSNLAIDKQMSNNSTSFTMKHTLGSVLFLVDLGNYPGYEVVRIKNVSLTNVVTDGYYVPSTTVGEVGTWTLGTTKQTVSATNYPNSADNISATGRQNGVFLLIPQSLKQYTMQLTMTVEIRATDGSNGFNTLTIPAQNAFTLSLPTVSAGGTSIVTLHPSYNAGWLSRM